MGFGPSPFQKDLQNELICRLVTTTVSLAGRLWPKQSLRKGVDDPYKVGYFVGSLSTPINRELSKALIRLAPEDLEFTEIPIGNLPLYSPDYDENFPPEARAMKEAIAESDAILFDTPEYNRGIPGGLKNAVDWASRPWGQNSFDHMAAAVIGASSGRIGTAMAQQSVRAVLSFCNARQMTAPEAYINSPGSFPETERSPTSPPRFSSPTTWRSSGLTSLGSLRSYRR